VVQSAFFAPRGLPGFGYWYALYPFHRRIFNDLIHALAKALNRLRFQDTAA
jgi:hypothetical protein